MSKIYLVRHGQASFMTDDYDQLSPLGRRQGFLLGDYWGRRGLPFHKLFVGPHRRHQQTFNAFAEGYEQHGLRLAQPQVVEAFSEHGGFQLFKAIMPTLVGVDPFVTEHYRAEGMDRQSYLAINEYMLEQWAGGAFSAENTPIWHTFRETVAEGMAQVAAAIGQGHNALVFTSGGTIAAAVGNALEMNDVAAVKLNWIVRNTAYAEFYSRDDQISLFELNAVPHIDDAAELSYL